MNPLSWLLDHTIGLRDLGRRAAELERSIATVLLRGADLSGPTLRLDIAFLAGAAILFVTLAGATIRREVA